MSVDATFVTVPVSAVSGMQGVMRGSPCTGRAEREVYPGRWCREVYSRVV